MGRDPFLGRVCLLLGRQNLCFIAIIVIYGSPNCVLLSFVGRQLLNVENHCSRGIGSTKCHMILLHFQNRFLCFWEVNVSFVAELGFKRHLLSNLFHSSKPKSLKNWFLKQNVTQIEGRVKKVSRVI